MGNDIVQEGEARTLEITLQDLDEGVVVYKNNAIYDRNGKREIKDDSGSTYDYKLALRWGGYVDGNLTLFLSDGKNK